MSKVLVTESSLSAIANAIRSKTGGSTTYKPAEMATAIGNIPTGITPTGTVSITQNGTVDVTQYASAAVNVPNSYSASDEGKVVSNGALVEQTSRASEIISNGTYDTTNNNSVTVSVSGGGSDWPQNLTQIEYIQNTHSSNPPYFWVSRSFAANDIVEIETSPDVLGTESAFFGNDNSPYLEVYYSSASKLAIYGTAGTDLIGSRDAVVGTKYTSRFKLNNYSIVTGFRTLRFGAYKANQYVFKGKIYRFKRIQVVDGLDVVLADYIPARHTNGDVGMYDVVNCVFQTSETVNKWTAGPDAS